MMNFYLFLNARAAKDMHTEIKSHFYPEFIKEYWAFYQNNQFHEEFENIFK